MEENIFQTYLTMVRQGLLEQRNENTPLIVHHYEDKGQLHGSFDKDKIEKMAKGRKLGQTHISDYHGHLMSKDYN